VLFAGAVKLVCRAYPFTNLRIKKAQKKPKPRDGKWQIPNII
jgi:hypothetical protein